jgi:hypothetical protein
MNNIHQNIPYECDIAVTCVNFLEKIVPGLCQVAQLQRSQGTADAALGVLWALPGVGPSSLAGGIEMMQVLKDDIQCFGQFRQCFIFVTSYRFALLRNTV